uniref:Uncharacterized protein AlNc14C69G4805 n=1 Tax=Albugo laibachii Nc14 TaxID=890382 RepID=F0WDT7_9STRA|nr:conserved hypothetical protein [Albugo laibachii Nc14]|eukprot:CCA19364.1 conserved hypothetical protein [Albugo laibachii Nc14]
MNSQRIMDLDRILSSIHIYFQKTRVRNDVFHLSRQIPSLLPASGTFTYNDGSSGILLHLGGTIPIYFHNDRYNIPVEFWVVETYPMAPPVCFVRPTAEMMIRPRHPHVSKEGFIVIPYLTDWQENNTLVELVAHLSSIFGEIPPVFQRPKYERTAELEEKDHTQRTEYRLNSIQSDSDSQRQSSSFHSVDVENQRNSVEERAKRSLKNGVIAKLQLSVQRSFQDIKDDIDLQLEHQLQLEESKTRVEKGIASLERICEDLVEKEKALKQKHAQVDEWLQKYDSKSQVDVDSIVVPKDSLTAQLLSALAEYHSCEDALYYLDRCLSNGNIPFDVFLKQVRKLSTKQYLSLALAQKLAQLQREQVVGH